jgi:hypothetical protein
LQTAFYRCGERNFSGFVLDHGNLSRRFAVDILVDGHSVQVIRADACVSDLVRNQTGDGCYGFSCSLHEAAVTNGAVVEARVANLGTSVGVPIALSESYKDRPLAPTPRTVRWLGGLRFSGTMAAQQQPIANVLVDGALITRIRPSAWSHVASSHTNARAEPAFDFHLPARFADGNVHYLLLTDESGENISDASLAFVAFSNGLQELVARHGQFDREGLRAQLFDRLLPMSVPFSDYQNWRERFPALPGPPVALAGAVAMIGAGALEDTLETLNAQSHGNWIAGSLPQMDDPFSFRPEQALEFLAGDAADSSFVVFALAGTLFTSDALGRIAGAFAQLPEAQVIYPDLDLQTDDGSLWPLGFRLSTTSGCSSRDTAHISLPCGAPLRRGR